MEMRGENGLFAKIARHEIPAEIVYEDELTLAFLDKRPINPGHTLVIPKKPFVNLYDLDDQTRDSIFKTVQKIAISLKQGLDADGVNVRINTESAAGQDVFHFHAHVIPRYENDGYENWHGKEYQEGEREIVGEKIRSALT
jgi:histidine triad (HIT) family protein